MSAAEGARPAGPLALLGLALVLGVLLLGGFFLWTQDTRRGGQQPEYSIARTDDRGAAVVYRLFRDAGIDAEVWDRPLTRLDRPGLLIFLAPARPSYLRLLGRRTELQTAVQGEFFPDEIAALDAWVEKGGVAVVMAREENDLYRGVGLIVDEPEGISGEPAAPVQPGVLAEGVSRLRTHSTFGFKFGRREPEKDPTTGERTAVPEPPIRMIPPGQWVELFVKKEGGRSLPQVVAAARGRGLYVAVNDVFPAGNLGISEDDNARFMLNLARLAPAGGRIWFDEYHKRTADRGFVSYLRERALFPALVYAALLVGLLLWRSGVRFGAPEPLVADRRRDSGEYVRAVAALYQNARMFREALATVHGDFRRRLIGALRLDGLADLEAVGRRYEMRTGRPAMEAREVLVEAEAALARPGLTEEDALRCCARLTRLDEVLHSGPRAGPERRKKTG